MTRVGEFLETLRIERGASPHTVAAYRRDLSRFERFLTERKVSVEKADEADLSAHLLDLRRHGLGPRSVARHLAALRGLYRFLRQRGPIRRDPTEFLENPRLGSRLPRVLSPREAALPSGTTRWRDPFPMGVTKPALRSSASRRSPTSSEARIPVA